MLIYSALAKGTMPVHWRKGQDVPEMLGGLRITHFCGTIERRNLNIVHHWESVLLCEGEQNKIWTVFVGYGVWKANSGQKIGGLYLQTIEGCYYGNRLSRRYYVPFHRLKWHKCIMDNLTVGKIIEAFEQTEYDLKAGVCESKKKQNCQTATIATFDMCEDRIRVEEFIKAVSLASPRSKQSFFKKYYRALKAQTTFGKDKEIYLVNVSKNHIPDSEYAEGILPQNILVNGVVIEDGVYRSRIFNRVEYPTTVDTPLHTSLRKRYGSLVFQYNDYFVGRRRRRRGTQPWEINTRGVTIATSNAGGSNPLTCAHTIKFDTHITKDLKCVTGKKLNLPKIAYERTYHGYTYESNQLGKNETDDPTITVEPWTV